MASERTLEIRIVVLADPPTVHLASLTDALTQALPSHLAPVEVSVRRVPDLAGAA